MAKGNGVGNCFAGPSSSPSHQLPLPCKAQIRTKWKSFSFKWKNILAEPLCSKLSHHRAKGGIGFLISPFILSPQAPAPELAAPMGQGEPHFTNAT